MTLYATINRYYAKYGRLKGDGQKAKGCFMVARPTAIAYTALFGVYAGASYLKGTSPCWWASLPILGYILAPFICLWWVHNSDAWRDEKKQARLGLIGGLIAFTLIGQPWLGLGMWLKGSVYKRSFTPETPNSKKIAEELETELLGRLLISSVACYAAFYVWRLL